MQNAKPFLKWAGGKTQLLPELRKRYPASLGSSVNKYCEPFVGGGAALFDLLNHFKFESVLINDINTELINAYNAVKNSCEPLISALSALAELYAATAVEARRTLYLQKRARYNELLTRQSKTAKLEKAALFIFLNKTCFNGLYRVNKKGEFNVPFNRAKNPPICDADNLRACSLALKNVEMRTEDYASCADFIDERTFVYIDPPYRPLSATADFTSYTKGGFNDDEQIRLSGFIEQMSERGALVLASNSDPKNADESDDFFDRLYFKFEIERVTASRMINANASGRGAINEIIVANF